MTPLEGVFFRNIPHPFTVFSTRRAPSRGRMSWRRIDLARLEARVARKDRANHVADR